MSSGTFAPGNSRRPQPPRPERSRGDAIGATPTRSASKGDGSAPRSQGLRRRTRAPAEIPGPLCAGHARFAPANSIVRPPELGAPPREFSFVDRTGAAISGGAIAPFSSVLAQRGTSPAPRQLLHLLAHALHSCVSPLHRRPPRGRRRCRRALTPAAQHRRHPRRRLRLRQPRSLWRRPRAHPHAESRSPCPRGPALHRGLHPLLRVHAHALRPHHRPLLLAHVAQSRGASPTPSTRSSSSPRARRSRRS